jgi:GT2 family glycosyltransferase
VTLHAVGANHRLVTLPSARCLGNAFAMTAFSGDLPPSATGRWCRFTLSLDAAAHPSGPLWAKLEMADSARGHIVREAFFPPPDRATPARLVLLMHVPHASGGFSLSLFAPHGAAAPVPVLRLQVLGRVAATLRLLAAGWRCVAVALPGNPLGVLGRARALLGQDAARRGQAPPYAVWTDLYDSWGEPERHALLSPGMRVDIAVRVLADGNAAAMAETMAAIAAQWLPPAEVSVIGTAQDWRMNSCEWVVVLAPGERLAPHALACLARVACRHTSLLAICADIDYYDTDGQRSSAGLRPPPDPWLIQSGLFSSGAWMFHRSAIGPDGAAVSADRGCGRRALVRSIPVARMRRVPLILTHCPMPAPPGRVQPHIPEPAQGKTWPHVSIIVPSACRSWHVLRCLGNIARLTDYPAFDIVVAVSASDPADRRQARIMRRVGALPRVRVIILDMPDFNFAAVINKAAARARGSLLLLLNDDVSPIAVDWLQKLVDPTEAEDDRRADIVGPRLLYGNRLVQHAGVIMGLGNLCEHAFRLARSDDPGPQGLARLDRQVCAVTAACLLVRRALFESLGGLDEAFAIALNDADFCLRAGQAGARILFAAGVDMYHFESLSLGRHYHGARAGLEAVEVRRLRDRWGFHIMADPFYHPCASLQMGREFHPGFPPRQTPLSWIGPEPPALE